MNREEIPEKYDILVEGPREDGSGDQFLLVVDRDEQRYAVLYAQRKSASFLSLRSYPGGPVRASSMYNKEKWYRTTGEILNKLEHDAGNRGIFVGFKEKVKEYFK